MAATLPNPSTGQPLDVAYIGNMVNTINSLVTEVASSKGKDSTVNDQTKKTAELKFFALTKTISNPAVTAGGSQTFEVALPGFKYAPVITATPVTATSGLDVTVAISSVTSANATGIVKFGSSGVVSVDIHIIAIGIPNWNV